MVSRSLKSIFIYKKGDETNNISFWSHFWLGQTVEKIRREKGREEEEEEEEEGEEK